MAFAKLSAENRIKESLTRLDCTASFIATLAGIPANRLSEAFRGVKELSNKDAELIEEILKRIDMLVLAFEPVPISLVNPTKIKALLNDIEDRRLAEAYCVRFGRSWFCSREAGQVKSSFSMLMSTSMDHLTAEKIAAALNKMLPDAEAEVVRNPFASADSIVDSFDDVWNETR
jgi:hypothetical protein